MLFSLLIVSLNSGEKLKNTLKSALNQTFTDFEVIIKDGGSTDDSFDQAMELLEDSRVKVYREKDKGIYDAMNQAIEKACGEYVYFLNCGDYLYDDKTLQQVAKAIEENRGKYSRMVVYGNMYHRGTESFVTHAPKITGFTCYRNVPCHQACFYDRRLVQEKPFDLSFRIRCDYEQFLWCYYKGDADFVYLPAAVASYEGGGYSETKENLEKSAKEHQSITAMYMTARERFRYRAALVITLQPLRTRMANSKHFAKLYNGLRKMIYRQ